MPKPHTNLFDCFRLLPVGHFVCFYESYPLCFVWFVCLFVVGGGGRGFWGGQGKDIILAYETSPHLGGPLSFSELLQDCAKHFTPDETNAIFKTVAIPFYHEAEYGRDLYEASVEQILVRAGVRGLLLPNTNHERVGSGTGGGEDDLCFHFPAQKSLRIYAHQDAKTTAEHIAIELTRVCKNLDVHCCDNKEVLACRVCLSV
jgi:hypothetical protein